MTKQQVVDGVKEYISQAILEGKDDGLNETTPLLEWGILNSMEMTRLIMFIGERFAVQVPAEEVIPENFQTISCIADLVGRLA
jgi:medium-chain acyl-[acyl-carrier-protein] hydrolase